MLPTNGNEKNCDPVSSNCVIWQGPDIPCINLCNGDSVSDVVFKLATELCDLLDLFKIENYDLSCLSNCPKVEDIQQLIQLIINNLCQLQDCCTQTPSTPGTARDIDTVVPVAACFYYVNPQGDTVTSMKLVDYATAAGNRICTITQQVTTLQSIAANHETRITALEDKPDPVFVIPDVTPVCVSEKVPTPMNQVLVSLEAAYCGLVNATGIPNEIFLAISKQPPNLNSSARLAPGGGAMSSLPGWYNTLQNLAQSHSNMWLTIQDLRASVSDIKANCCPSGCADVVLNLEATLTGGTTLKLFFTGTIPAGFTECTGTTLVTVTDTDGASISFYLSVPLVINDPSGYSVDISSTPLNPALNFTVTSNVCLKNGSIPAECSTLLQYVLLNSMTCPSVTLTPTTDSMVSPATSEVEYSFNHTGGSLTYQVSLYEEDGSTLIQSQSTPVTGPTTVSGTFTGLTPSTLYKVRVSMLSGGAITNCAFESVTTPAP